MYRMVIVERYFISSIVPKSLSQPICFYLCSLTNCRTDIANPHCNYIHTAIQSEYKYFKEVITFSLKLTVSLSKSFKKYHIFIKHISQSLALIALIASISCACLTQDRVAISWESVIR